MNQNEIQLQKQRNNTKKLFQKLMKSFATPPDMTVSEWADAYRMLSPESSAEPGKWRTDRAPYQKEIMDAVSDDKCYKVVIMSSAQIGKSEIILNMIGYHIDYDPAPIMYVLPTDSMAATFSKDRVGPMIRDTPSLKSKVMDAKSRDSGNTIFHKKFSGGHLTFIGANTPSQLASRPIRILLADEIDRFPDSAGTEGDPLQLAIKRTTTFWNRKIIEVSTPTIKGVSKIEKEFESSSMERLNVACPHCGKFQTYEWEQLKFEHESGTTDFKLLGYKCRHCGEIEREVIWKRQPIKWVADHPERKEIRGFHLNELASPWKHWDEIVEDFLEAKRQGREMLKVWHNTSLGLSWEEDGDLDIKDILLKRREFYNCEVPKDVVVLTCGVDVQDNRLEYEIVGWAKDKVSFGIKYGVLYGDPGKEEVWKMLDDVIFTNYKRVDGLEMQIMTTCIDSGGHHTSEVYQYCKKREMRRVWAIKGQGGSGVSYIQRPTKRNQSGAWLFNIGVDVGKDTMASRLKTNFVTEPGFCHFPMEADKGYDEQYFEGLTAEKRNIRTISGRVVINWVKKYEGIRNEPFDIRNYATAALEILNPNLDQLHRRFNEDGERPSANTTTQKRKRKGTKGISIY